MFAGSKTDLKVNISCTIYFNIELAVIFYSSDGLGSNLIQEFMFPRELSPFHQIKLTFGAMAKIKCKIHFIL